MVLLLDSTPVIRHPRKARARAQCDCSARYFQIGVTLVIPKQNVVFGIQRLDQIILE